MSFEQERARQGPSTTPPGGSGVLGTTATAADQAARDRQTTLTYLMARRVTDAPGCEHKPPEQAPAVTSGDTQ